MNTNPKSFKDHEMAEPTPMPEITVGTWVMVCVGALRLDRVEYVVEQDHYPRKREYHGLSGLYSADQILEARFPDGRIWRREEPPR